GSGVPSRAGSSHTARRGRLHDARLRRGRARFPPRLGPARPRRGSEPVATTGVGFVKRVAVTTTADTAPRVSEPLIAHGLVPVMLPCISISPAGPDALAELRAEAA